MGVAKTLEDYSSDKEFLSCFPLAEHFTHLDRLGLPSKELKFGKDEKDGTCFHHYERSQFEQCSPFWEQVEEARMVHRIQTWIGKTKAECQPGDVIDIAFFCHGFQNGALQMGSTHWQASQVIEWLEKFGPDVQVNLLTGSCYGGTLGIAAKRNKHHKAHNTYFVSSRSDNFAYPLTRSCSGTAREGRLANAFIESITKAFQVTNLDEISNWTVDQHEAHICHRLRNVTPDGNNFEPAFTHAGFDPLIMPLKKIMNLQKGIGQEDDKVVLKNDDWATAHTVVHGTFKRALAHTSKDVPASAIAIAKAECSLCNVNGGFVADLQIYDQLYVEKTDWFLVLINMYWRSLRQAAIWNVFLHLLKKHLVNTDALQLPIDIMCCSTATHWFTRFLCCFDVIVSQADEAWSGKIPGQGVEWLTDINWYGASES
ncbi:hypothetical protein N7493_001726 [Penicillium malachiteum]|uniref:Uncharacterized protein n=1 Tax=Penicillium malachiteum TaxID=1324776 RepID=A0AAD6N0L7_9EURO|nr:hypothetical protein N7493_001726 [Penicillium malachiteum]